MIATVASRAGRPDRANEDYAAATPEVAVLLDGAGLPGHLATGCIHGVPWYVNQLGPAILRHAHDRGRSLPAALAAAITEVSGRHSDTCDLSNPNSPSATVVIVRANGADLEGLVLADSTLAVRKVDGSVATITDDRLGRLPKLPAEQHAQYRNRDGGFWVASTDPAAADHARTVTLSRDQVVSLTLLSDGAARLADLFHQLSWSELIDRIEQLGPAPILNATRQAEQSDPEGRRWPRSKHSDDATILHLAVEPALRAAESCSH